MTAYFCCDCKYLNILLVLVRLRMMPSVSSQGLNCKLCIQPCEMFAVRLPEGLQCRSCAHLCCAVCLGVCVGLGWAQAGGRAGCHIALLPCSVNQHQLQEGAGSSVPCTGISGAGSWHSSTQVVLLSAVKYSPSLEQVNKQNHWALARSCCLCSSWPRGGSPPPLF